MSDVLQNLSDELAGVVEATGPALVRVEARRRLPASGIVWSADGLIVTANHVLEADEGIRIGFQDGETAEAQIVGRDPSTDLALLRTDRADLSAPEWGDINALKVGNIVLALGRPAENPLATLGVVSALEENWRMSMGNGGGRKRGSRRRGGQGRRVHLEYFLQTDVVMYPGFSGGPLVAANGQLLGLNTSALLRGISLTLTPPTLMRVMGVLATHGRVQRGYLGVGVQPVELPADVAAHLGQAQGVMVVSVEPDSPAAAGGFVLGDTLVQLDGDPVQDVDELLGSLTGERVGQSVPVMVLRAGAVQEFEVTIGERPE
ncbi:MAG: S1C family serine protease [Anaerolineales bacterium]